MNPKELENAVDSAEGEKEDEILLKYSTKLNYES